MADETVVDLPEIGDGEVESGDDSVMITVILTANDEARENLAYEAIADAVQGFVDDGELWEVQMHEASVDWGPVRDREVIEPETVPVARE